MDCTWTAVHDHMPVGPTTLRVTGECQCPTQHTKAALTRKELQGINPKDLLLELNFKTPDKVDLPVVTACTATYEEETDFEYDTVTVLGEVGGTVKVQDVH